jgi:hypothetical protein
MAKVSYGRRTAAAIATPSKKTTRVRRKGLFIANSK